MKDCKKIHPLLAFYIEEELTPVEKGRMDQHLKVCSDARGEFEAYQQLHSASKNMPEPKMPKDLHEKIMARVTGKVQPLGSRRPLWVFPAWGLATAACLSIFLLIQDPDLLTFNAKKTSPPPEPFEKAASSLNAPKPFSPVPLNKAIAEKKEAPQTSANENLDNKVISKNFAASEEAPPASAPKPMALKHLEKKTRRDTTAFAAADEANSPSALPASNPADQVMANAPQAQGASAEKVDALRENGAMAAPTEGSLENLSYLKQITASKWTGNNAPVTVETQELVTDGLDFKQDWQELRPGEEVPRVDFTTQAVVLLMAGEEPTPGYSIHVSALEEKVDQIVIHYQLEAPMPGTSEAQVLTHPWSMQVIPKSPKPVLFQKEP